MGSRERAVMGLESHEVSARVTIYCKTCYNKNIFQISNKT